MIRKDYASQLPLGKVLLRRKMRRKTAVFFHITHACMINFLVTYCAHVCEKNMLFLKLPPQPITRGCATVALLMGGLCDGSI